MYNNIRYNISDFNLLPFELEKIPQSMLDTLEFIATHATYAIHGGAACRLMLKERTPLTDLDVLVSADNEERHFVNSFCLFSSYIFWDTNFFGQDKCILFWPGVNGYYKLELNFCDTIQSTQRHIILIHGQRKKIISVSGEWLWVSKLEKVGRDRKSHLPEHKLRSHANAVISLGTWMIQHGKFPLPLEKTQLDALIAAADYRLRHLNDLCLLNAFLSVTENIRTRCIGQ